MNSLIELKNISKHYIVNKKTTILRRVNFKFKKGLIYSLVGPSGSGKSTLLNILSLIDKPSSGEIVINNNPIKYNDISKLELFINKIIYCQILMHLKMFI
jgi:ABC-type lipoprotein export system ATPase subunit